MKRSPVHAVRSAALGGMGVIALVASLQGMAQQTPDPETLMAAGRYREAVEAARERIEGAGAAGHDAHLLADALAASGEPAEAIETYTRALTNDPGHRLQIEVSAAKLLRLKGDFAEADGRLRQVLEAYRQGGDPLVSTEVAAVADAARLLGHEDPARFRQALRLYEQAIARDEGNLAARVALADLLLEKYNNAEALALYREVLEIDEHYAPALLGLARSHYFDHSRTAVDVVRRALEVQPSLVAARVLLARILLEMEQYEAADEEIGRALEVNPASPQALTMRLVVRHLTGDRAGFEALEARLRRQAPGYHEVYATLAETAAQHRLYADAVAFARKAVARDPGFSRAHGLLGINLMRLGRIDAGRGSLERAFRGDPFNVWFKNTLDLLDRMDGFASVRRGRFILTADPRDVEVLAPRLFPLAEAAYARFAERYGHEPPTPVRIEIYPSHEDFSVRTVGLVGLDILGVSFGPTLAFPSPAADTVGANNWGSVLWHELAHTFHLSMSRSRVPRWLTEGLAVVEEHRARLGWGQDVDPGFLDAYRQGRLPPASRLNEAFMRPTYPEQVAHAYLQGSLLADFIEERYGVEAITAMLRAYGEGGDTASILEAQLGLTPEALDRAFDDYLRARFAGPLAALGAAPAAGGPGGDETGADAPSFRALWRTGSEALAAGDLDRAETALSGAKRLFPGFAGAGSPYHLLAQLYLRRGDTAAAIDELETVVAIDADDLGAHRQLAELYLNGGNDEAAARIMERSLYIDPFDVEMRERLAAIHEAKGAWARAVAERSAAVHLDPMDPAGARYRLANALARNDEYAAARRQVLRALEIAPMYDDALELLLEVREALGPAADGASAPAAEADSRPVDHDAGGIQ